LVTFLKFTGVPPGRRAATRAAAANALSCPGRAPSGHDGTGQDCADEFLALT